nr:unnamed protein product [Callosobruchus analis]
MYRLPKAVVRELIDMLSGLLSPASRNSALDALTKALNHPTIFNRWIKFPSTLQELQVLREQFYMKFGFRGVIGCIDCTHVAIISPHQQHPDYPEHLYINRKHYHSINVQLICDSNLRILNINAILEVQMMHSYGITLMCLLKHRVLHYGPETASQIINACAVLHNICIANNVEEPELGEGDEHIDFGLLVNTVAYREKSQTQNRRVNPLLAEGRRIQRRLIQNYF